MAALMHPNKALVVARQAVEAAIVDDERASRLLVVGGFRDESPGVAVARPVDDTDFLRFFGERI